MSELELIEKLSDAEHSSWARWMAYLLSKCELQRDGSLLLPVELVLGWHRQMHTAYADLSEQEKQYDREEVAHILPIIERYARDYVAEVIR